MTQEVKNYINNRSLQPEFFALIGYLFFIIFAPQERYAWLVPFRPALSFAVLTIVLYFMGRSSQEVYHGSRIPIQGYLLILLSFFFLISIFLNPIFDDGISTTLISYLKLVVLYFLIVAVVKNEYDFEVLTWTVIIFVGLLSIYSLFAYKFGWGEIRFRMASPFGGMGSNPNGFALLLLGILPFPLMFLQRDVSLAKKILLVVISLSILLCIIKTRSRMGFLGIAFLLGLIAWHDRKRIKIVLLTMLIFIIPILHAHENFWERIKSIKETQLKVDRLSSARQNKWRQAIFLIQKHPLSGVGLSGFRRAVRYYGLGEDEHVVHNGYLEIGAETGIVSMLIFLTCIWLTIKKNKEAMKYYKERREKRMFTISSSLHFSMLGFAFCLLFLSEQYNSMLFVLMGLSASSSKLISQFDAVKE